MTQSGEMVPASGSALKHSPSQNVLLGDFIEATVTFAPPSKMLPAGH